MQLPLEIQTEINILDNRTKKLQTNISESGCLTDLLHALSACIFIHSGDLYSASSRHYYSEPLSAQSWPKKDLREM